MGDASFGMSVGELETIMRLQIQVVLIVLSNASYSWVKAGQKARGDHYYGVDFSKIDHAQVAKAFGVEALRVGDPNQLNDILKKVMKFHAPVLIDVIVQPLQDSKAPVSKWIV
jgi:acetolactate synthase-1/2/3 large subunit